MKFSVNPFTVFSVHHSIRLHFERGTYDAFKYNFKGPRIKPKTFEKSRDRFCYEKIAMKYRNDSDNLIDFLLANHLVGNSWIRDCDNDVYDIWLGRIQSLTYSFNLDANKIYDYSINNDISFDDLFVLNRYGKVPILDLLKRNLISEESVVILDSILNFLKPINKHLEEDPLDLLSDTNYRLRQYRPFLEKRINKSAAKNTLQNLFTSNAK